MIAKRVCPPNQLGLGLNLSTKKTRKREFLDEMDQVVPWGALVQIVEPHSPLAKTGRPPFAIEAMLRIHYLQQWFGLSDPAMEEALHDVPLYREFAGLGDGVSRLPDESTILRFRHLLEAHDLAVDMLRVVNDILQAKGLLLRTGTAVDATLIAAPSSTKNAQGERDPEMHQTKKGNQWYFGMKAYRDFPRSQWRWRVDFFRSRLIEARELYCLKQGTDCTSTAGLVALRAAPDTNRSAGLHSHRVASD
jgi:transposase, IS5 family